MANIVKTFFMLIRGKFLIILTFRFFFFNWQKMSFFF
jgi:hypothetical protein